MPALMLSPYLPDPPDHGGRQRSRLFLEALAATCRVTLAAPLEGEAADRAEALARELRLQLLRLPPPPPPQARRPLAKLRAWCSGRADLLERRWNREARRTVARHIGANQPLVVADSSFVLPLLPAAVPGLVLHLHNVESHVLVRNDGSRRGPVEAWVRKLEARGVRRAETQAAGSARLVVTVSGADRQRLLQLVPRARIEVVENAVDLDRLRLLAPPTFGERPLLLLVGSFDYPPNLEAARTLCLDHLAALRRAVPGVRVRLVGHDPDQRLQELAGLAGVEVVGYAADLRPHYQEAAAVYAPIRSGGGSRLKLLEAFALGRPVITTRIGIEGLEAMAGRHYCEAETGEAAADALQRLPAMADGLIRAARELVESSHSWTHARDRLRGSLAPLL